jgi:divalent metal cation (Fe/Co/Zn/Cd) transporter
VNASVLLYEGYGMLMDRSLSPEEVKQIKELINTYQEDFYRRDNLRTRSSGTTKFIEFTLYFDAKKKSFTEIYKICLFLKKHLEDDVENSVVTIVPRPLER